jgi:neutral ceramidase
MSPFFKTTLSVIVSIAFSILVPQVGYAQLQAGIARVDVTPPLGGPMYGYGARGTNGSTGIHDLLYAKALVLDDGMQKLALVTLDLGAIRHESTANIKALVQQQTDISHVLLVASHTHSGPRAVPDFPSAEAPWIRDAEQRIAEVIIAANANRVPVRIGAGWGEVREGHNRRMIRTDGEVVMLWGNRDRIPTHPVDYQLGVIRIEGADGPVATLINYTCHPVVLGPDNLSISADYPGVMMRIIEEGIGGQAMFLPGAQGDINPFWDKTPVDEGGFEQVERMGRAVAEEALRVSNQIVEYEAMPKLSIQTEQVALALREDIARAERPIQAEINTVLIGENMAFGTFPGEFFVEHGLTFKARSPFHHTFFIGYTNDALAYFPTIQSTTEGGYGAATTTQVEVGAGERLVNRALVNLLYQAGKIAP